MKSINYLKFFIILFFNFHAQAITNPDLWIAPSNLFPNHSPMKDANGREVIDSNGQLIYPGASDYMSLFTSDTSLWSTTLANIKVVKFYGEWLAFLATDSDLQTVSAFLKKHNLKMAIEFGTMSADPKTGCGTGIETFSRDQWPTLLSRLKTNNLIPDYMELDEPYFYASIYGGPYFPAPGVNTCNWDAITVAKKVDEFIKIVKLDYPSIIFHDVEPVFGPNAIPLYQQWLKTFAATNGYSLPAFNADVTWSPSSWANSNWQTAVKTLEQSTKALGIKFGIIYTGGGAITNQSWYTNALSFVNAYQGTSISGSPDYVVLQSWDYKPDRVLPENTPYTFTNFAVNYLKQIALINNPTGATGDISALDNPCVLTSEFGTCKSQITWQSTNALSACLFLKETSQLVACGPKGSINIPWISKNGFTFELHLTKEKKSLLLASLKVDGKFDQVSPVPTPTPTSTSSNSIPFGLFMVSKAVGYSNGLHYCIYPDWNTFVRLTGRNSVSGITEFSTIPLGMINDGSCH